MLINITIRFKILKHFYQLCPPGATLIQMAPQDVMLPEGTEAKFTCTATTDPEEIQNLRLYWMKDGVEIDYAVR